MIWKLTIVGLLVAAALVCVWIRSRREYRRTLKRMNDLRQEHWR